MEVMNRLKHLDLREYLKNYGQELLTLYRKQWPKPSPRRRDARRQSGFLRKLYKELRKEEKQSQGWKVRHNQMSAELQWTARGMFVSLLSQPCDSLLLFDWSPPGPSVHGTFQVRILEWVAISFSRVSSQPTGWNCVTCIVGRFFTCWGI